MRVAGKVALISGAAHGMGAEEARLFAREGARVVIADVLEEEGTRLAAELTTAGGEALFVRTDVTQEDDWRQVVQRTVAQFGTLDILVNNAGLSSTSVADPLDTEGWRRIMDVNATGVFLGTKYAIPPMQRARRGAIVNISSIMGFVGGRGAIRPITPPRVRYASSRKPRLCSMGPTASGPTPCTPASCLPCGRPIPIRRRARRRWG